HSISVTDDGFMVVFGPTARTHHTHQSQRVMNESFEGGDIEDTRKMVESGLSNCTLVQIDSEGFQAVRFQHSMIPLFFGFSANGFAIAIERK
ncbi:MAG: hypothetical protein ACFE7R_10000, partial [Candidatus Hodarchaeota archaeon]